MATINRMHFVQNSRVRASPAADTCDSKKRQGSVRATPIAPAIQTSIFCHTVTSYLSQQPPPHRTVCFGSKNELEVKEARAIPRDGFGGQFQVTRSNYSRVVGICHVGEQKKRQDQQHPNESISCFTKFTTHLFFILGVT
jgi:hypothetical protein